jgi:hypothetical protein
MVDDDDGDDVPLFVPSTGRKGAPPAKCSGKRCSGKKSSGVEFRTTAVPQ